MSVSLYLTVPRIINVNDTVWKEAFDDDEKVEIIVSSCANFKKPLLASLNEAILHRNGEMNYRRLHGEISSIDAQPVDEPDLYWMKQSLLGYIDLFMHDDTLPHFETELDLLQDVYGFIKTSRMLSRTATTTSSGSKSSSEASNSNRTIGSTDNEPRQKPPKRADLTFHYLSTELACVEIGLNNLGPSGIKELNEREIKVPKMLKGFLCRAFARYNTMKIDLMPVGFVISGVHITALIMERKGSTSVVVASKRLKMPESLSEVPRLLPPVLRLVYNCAMIIKKSANDIRHMTSTVPSESELDEEMCFPPVFVPSPTRKRKRQ